MEPLYPKILRKSLEVAEQKAKGFCRSRQLRRAINRQIITISAEEAGGKLNVPHYWAIYYHEGRQVIRPVSASMLVWFRNPNNDPRLKGGLSPVYRSDIRKLTKAEFQFWSEENRRARKRGAPVPMIVVKRSPRSGQPSWKGNPFFSDKPGGGLAGLPDAVIDISRREAYSHVEEWLRTTGLKKKTVRVNL
jgi:hypothetical protein